MNCPIDFTLKNSRNLCKPEKREFARNMRKNQTESERILWEEIRCKKLGVKFRRQCIITGWIVDFYCPELKLIIEVDGDYHKNQTEKDSYRDFRLRGLNLNIIRINNDEILKNLPQVIDNIKEYIKTIKTAR